MQVLIDEVDYTDKLLEDGLATLTQELERGAFRRVVSDLALELSDLYRTFTNLFAGVLGTTRITIKITEGNEIRFAGLLDLENLKFNVSNKRFTCDAFSQEAEFWGVVENVKVWGPLAGNTGAVPFLPTFISLDEFIDWQIQYTGLKDRLPWLKGYDIGSEYSDNVIRLANHSSEYGDWGRLVDMDPETSLADVLDILAIWNNAEYYVDYDTGRLQFVKRAQPRVATATDIDSILLDQPEAEIQLLDDQKFDYVRVFSTVTPPAPTFNAYALISPADTDTFYGVPGPQPQYAWAAKIGGQWRLMSEIWADRIYPVGQKFRFWMNVPPLEYVADWEGRALVRFVSGHGWYVVDATSDLYTNWVAYDYRSDHWCVQRGTRLPDNITNDFFSWRSYDETTGQWAADIIDWGDSTADVDGEILDIVRPLKFMTLGQSQELPIHTYYFLGGEISFGSIEKWRSLWKPLLLSKRVFHASVWGTDVKLGDRYYSGKGIIGDNDAMGLKPNQYVVRKAETDLIALRTKVELVAI
jgi:hypothetical protein